MFLDIDKHNREKIAIVDNEGNRLSYGELMAAMHSMGTKVPPRALVFVLCKNTAGSLAGFLGLVDNDAVPVTLDEKVDSELLQSLMNIYLPAYIWAPKELLGQLKFEQVLELYGYVLLKTENEIYPMHQELQICMSTSGTTGSPKLVRYKKGNLYSNAKNVARAFGWTENERAICDLGMQYTMGLNVMLTHLYVGATVLLTTYNLLSKDFWEFIKAEGGTNFTGVPFSYDILYRLRFERMDLPELKTLSEGGGKLSEERFRQLAEYAEKTGKRFIATFGTTETSARLSLLPPDMATSKIGSIGYALPEGELFLVNEDGAVIQDQVAEGELCYKGPNVTMGYALCKEDLSKGDEFNGEYRTGDLAHRDKDGYYYITGRLSRFLKLLSYRVSLDQVEMLIQQEFDIQCACTGTDQQMTIFITDEEYRANIPNFISEKLGLPKSLFKMVVIPELIRNESGKIQYKELEKML